MSDIKFQCSHGNSSWEAAVSIIKTYPYEAIITGNGNSFHVIYGKHEYGYYLVIPSEYIGCEMSYYNDVFWNRSALKKAGLDTYQAETIAQGIKRIGYLDMKTIKWNKPYAGQAYAGNVEIDLLKKEAGICTFKIIQLHMEECECEEHIYYLGQVGRNTFMYMDNTERRGHIIYDIQNIEETERLLMEDNKYNSEDAHILASALKLIATDNFNI